MLHAGTKLHKLLKKFTKAHESLLWNPVQLLQVFETINWQEIIPELCLEPARPACEIQPVLLPHPRTSPPHTAGPGGKFTQTGNFFVWPILEPTVWRNTRTNSPSGSKDRYALRKTSVGEGWRKRGRKDAWEEAVLSYLFHDNYLPSPPYLPFSFSLHPVPSGQRRRPPIHPLEEKKINIPVTRWREGESPGPHWREGWG